MNSSHQAISQPLPSGQPEQRVEVSLEHHEGAERVVVRCSTWTDGLGWCSQKTIHLDADQLDDLHRSITAARHRLARQRGQQTDRTGAPAQVIHLPTLSA